MVIAEGDKYDGQWKEGNMQGHGTLAFADGDKYEGGWKENEQNGQGTHMHASGGWSSGEWYNGVEQTPAVVETLLEEHGLEAFLQPILDIGVYAPRDMLLIGLEDLASIGMQTLHTKRFKRLSDELRLRQDPHGTSLQGHHAEF